MTLIEITEHHNSHEACRRYLEEKRWGEKPICPYCKGDKNSPKGKRYNCHSCRSLFSVTVGTVFENTKLPLNKWMMALVLILSAKKGISSLQLARYISVNKNTAWLLQMKIRAAMSSDKDDLFVRKIFGLCKEGLTKREKSKRIWINFQSQKKINTGERNGFWNQLQRAIIGQYHRIDEFYLHRYLDEINFKKHHVTLSNTGYKELLDRLIFVVLAKY